MKREYDFSKGRRGAVIKTSAGKVRITIRIDEDIIDWFRARAHQAGGGNYQTLINAALREHMTSEREPFADTVRKVVREELAAYRKRAKR
ncbi:MAG: BrnA antitoxin family protein [Candidatus Rokuibacteriota bacterium]